MIDTVSCCKLLLYEPNNQLPDSRVSSAES